MWYSHLSEPPTIRQLAPEGNFAWGLTPEGKEGIRGTGLNGWDVCSFAGSTNPKAAWEFLKFWTSSENMIAAVSTLPPRKSAAAAPRFAAEIPEAYRQGALEFGRPALSGPLAPRIFETVTEQVQMVLLGRSAPEKAAKELAESIRALL